MTYDPCDPCSCNDQKALNTDTYRQAMLQGMCQQRVLLEDIVDAGGIAANILSVIPGVGPTNLGKAEDAPALTGDTGVAQLIKRTDTAAVQTDTTGDYTVPVANSFGAAQVNIDSTFQASAATGLLKNEDALHASGDAGVQTLGVVQAVGTMVNFSTTQSDYVPQAHNPTGAQFMDINIEAIGSAYRAKSILKEEDVAHASGDAGVMDLGVVNVAGTSFAAAGDYCAKATTVTGATQINVDGNHIPSQATNLLKFEDTAHISGDVGVMSLAVYKGSPAGLVTTDGDYSPVVVGQYGAQYADINIGFQHSTANGILKAEDAASSSGDAGVAALFVGVDADALGNRVDTNSDYVNPISTRKGVVYVTVDERAQYTDGLSLLKLEDAVAASGDAGVAILLKRQDTPATQVADLDYTLPLTNNFSAQYVDIVRRLTPTETTPTINNATSTTIAAANTARRKIEIQNNSAANIMISMTGATLTGIVPSATNIGKVIVPGATYESPDGCASVAAITAYQTSGGAINTVTVTEYS